MAPRLSRGEYWLLTQVSEYGLPLRVVGLREGPPWSTPTLQEVLNCACHGMDRPTLARTLHRLFRRRWIEFHAPPFDAAANGAIILDVAGIERELEAPGHFSEALRYSLTPLGGRIWETFARPDWVRYIDDAITDFIEDDTAEGDNWECREVTTADRHTLQHYMDAVRNESIIRADSESVEMRNEWSYCYWKPPRSAYVWRFIAKDRERCGPPSTQWYRERWCAWR